MLIEQGKGKDAIGEIQQVIALDSTSGSAYRLLGRAHDFLGQTDSAAADYRQAIVLNEQDGWSMNNLGLVQVERGEYDEALKTLSRAVELSNAATFRNSLGLALEHTGHYTAAVEAYKSALSADSGYAKAQTNLARVSALTEAREHDGGGIWRRRHSSSRRKSIRGRRLRTEGAWGWRGVMATVPLPPFGICLAFPSLQHGPFFLVVGHSQMKATDIRRGHVIMIEGQPVRVMEFTHRTPGNLRAFVRSSVSAT